MRYFALLSASGTACAETTLIESDFTPANRLIVEGTIDKANPDAPIPGTWADVTGNAKCEAWHALGKLEHAVRLVLLWLMLASLFIAAPLAAVSRICAKGFCS